MTKKIQAWHFRAEPNTLRDGSPSIARIPDRYNGNKLILCTQGLHASIRPIDALGYAPGPYVARVECSGEIIKSDDKLVCSERTPLWIADATDVLRSFARWCARSVLHLWEAPPEVLRYINEEDLSEKPRVACWNATYRAVTANAASAYAVYDAARAAAVTRYAATDAARAAAATDAAYDAASAAYSPATSGTCAAYAARAAARAAANASGAITAARNKQNVQLEQMLLTLRDPQKG